MQLCFILHNMIVSSGYEPSVSEGYDNTHAESETAAYLSPRLYVDSIVMSTAEVIDVCTHHRLMRSLIKMKLK